MNAPLSKKLNEVKWGEFKIGDLFEIQNTLSFNANKLVEGNEYDYVTRTSFNQGILQTTGFVNKDNINPSGTWSLGLLQMDFFYRRKPWYAGQFVRKIVPKFDLPENAILFFTTLLNMQKKVLLSVLVRNVDKKFRNIIVSLPITPENKIDFDFMEAFIRELEEERICESEALAHFNELKWKEFRIGDLFDILTSKKRFDANKIKILNEGKYPYIVRTSLNNGIKGYLNESEEFLNDENTISFGQDTATMFYQSKPYFTGDKIKIVKYKNGLFNKINALYFLTVMNKSFVNFSWGSSSFNVDIIKDQTIMLPVTPDDSPDYAFMETFISAVQKLVIKDVVLYADKKIAATKQAVHKNPSEYGTDEVFGTLKVAEHN